MTAIDRIITARNAILTASARYDVAAAEASAMVVLTADSSAEDGDAWDDAMTATGAWAAADDRRRAEDALIAAGREWFASKLTGADAASVDAVCASALASGRAFSSRARTGLLGLLMKFNAAAESGASVRCLLTALKAI